MPDDLGSTFASALVVDDHPLFCKALTMTLRAMLGFGEVRTAATFADSLGELAGWQPDVILLDLNLPDVQGFDGLVQMTQAMPDTPVLVVSSMSDAKFITLALQAGANGFVPKHSEPDTIKEALEALSGGEIWTPPDYTPPADADATTEETLARLSELTLQQARILRLVCEGKLNKQIAWELSIAETTVKTHMTAIMRKLKVQSRTQAVLAAQQANFAKLLHDSVDSA
ncbi:MAG: response regulator transcription factor [Pseudomonadota bacterium]